MKKNILLIGGNGYTGKFFIKRFSEKYNIFSVSRSSSAFPKSVVQIISDLTDKTWTRHLPDINFNYVLWAAQSMEYKNFPGAAEDMFEVNVAAVQYLLSYLSSKNSKIIYLSSGTVYQPSDEPLSENSACMPINYLGQTKLMGEQLITCYSNYLDYYILRIFALYGAHQKGKLISNIVNSIKNNTEIYLNKERKLQICPLYVDDLLDLLEFIIDDNPRKNSTFNVAGDEVVSIEDIINIVSSALGVSPNLVYKDEKILNFVPQTSLLKSIFPKWNPTSFSQGIHNILTHS